MDVERTIEFLLQQNAAFEAHMQRAIERMDRADARTDRADARMDRVDARMDRFDRQLRVMARLGMAASSRAFSAIEAVAVHQREMQARLDAVIDLLERHLGGNGAAPA